MIDIAPSRMALKTLGAPVSKEYLNLDADGIPTRGGSTGTERDWYLAFLRYKYKVNDVLLLVSSLPYVSFFFPK